MRFITIFMTFFMFAPLAFTKAMDDTEEIKSIVEQIAEGWNQANGKMFYKNYSDSPAILMVESGGANKGVKDLVEHHVLPEKKHFQEMEVKFSDTQVHLSSNKLNAWTVSRSEFKAKTKNGKVIHNKGYQTMIFKKIKGQWTIVHSHSSSRGVKK